MASSPIAGSHTRFAYAPLLKPDAYVRLLVLQPGTPADALSGTLRAYRLGHLPPYEAISYCWGDSSVANQSQRIVLEGRELLITPNAADTLLYSRSCRVPVNIWLDQVCVNQDDAGECSQQVKLMSWIYERATRVVIHLGNDIQDADILFDCMRAAEYEADCHSTWLKRTRLKSVKRKPISDASPLRAVMRSGQRVSPRTMAMLEPHEHHVQEFRNALFELLAMPWFKRMWIVQEAALARNLVVRLGHRSVNWTGLYSVVADIAYHDFQRFGPLPDSMTDGLRAVSAIELAARELRRPLPWRKVFADLAQIMKTSRTLTFGRLLGRTKDTLSRRNRISILHLLREFRHQASTEKCDKLLGILGLTSPDLVRYGYLSRLPHMYTIVACCWFFAITYIQETGTLDVLSSSCHQAWAHEPLPLWCPDWSQEMPPCDTKYCHDTFSDPPHHAGTRHRARIGYFDFSKGCGLVLEGFQVDEVDAVVDDVFHIRNFSDPSDATWAAWTLFGMQQQHHASPYGSVEGQWDAYWRTLIYNCDGRGGFASASLGEIIKPFFSGVMDSKSKLARDTLKSRFVWKHRRLYRTKRGLLGNACCDVRTGDKIFICYGGRFPLVLRPDPDKVVSGGMAQYDDDWNADDLPKSFVGHRVIGGDTYVHGLCKGEGFQLAMKENMPRKLVCLI